jgi:hypothetical protein
VALFLFSGSLDAKFGRKPERIFDTSLAAPLTSRLPCDGFTSPEDHPAAKATFSPGGWERSFTVSVFQRGKCRVDLKIKCADEQKEGWRDTWTTKNDAPSKSDELSLRSCYAWGTSEPAQYLLSAWYREGSGNPKLPWKQVPVKKVSANPDVYEFSDPQGGTARLEIAPR